MNGDPNRLLRRDELPRSHAERVSERIMSNMRWRRILSALIDLAVAGVVGHVLLMSLVLPIFGINDMREWATGYLYENLHPHPVLLASYLALMLLKDIVRSPGKRIMKLKLTSGRDVVPVWKRVLRNLTVVIWPVEAIAILVSGRRVTDRLLGLDVTDAAETPEATDRVEGEKQP